MRASAVVVFAALTVPVALAQDQNWKGKTVILKGGPVTLIDIDANGVQAVLGNLRYTHYKVRDEKDGKVRVSQGGMEGWCEKTNLMPIDQALDYYNNLIATNPNVASYLSRRATVYRWLGEHDKALVDHDATVRLMPNEPVYLNNRGICHAVMRDYDKAIADYDAALKLKPEYGLTLRNRGLAWNGKKDFDKGLADFQQALQLDPRDANAMSGLGSSLAGKKRYAEAISLFERALQIDPHLSGARNGWAWLLATCPETRFRDGQKAVDLARAAVEESDWKSPGTIDTLAAAHAEIGQFQDAVRFQELALKDKTYARNNERAQRRLQLYKEMKPYREQ